MDSLRKKLQFQFQGFLATPPLWKNGGPINISQYLTQPVPSPEKSVMDLYVPDNLILGKRVEMFFAFFIKNFTSSSLLAQNVVINRGKTTIGEIDFLLLNEERKEYMHVELVYKYYLYDPEIKGDLSPWIGPNRKDSLLRKLQRLEDHQFPLLYREESRTLTEVLQLPMEKIIQKVCFKANLFVPLRMFDNKFPLINNECIQGFWIREKDFLERDYGEYLFHSPIKPDWPINPETCQEWYHFPDIKEQLISLIRERRSPLIWMKKSKIEYFRFFLVWW